MNDFTAIAPIYEADHVLVFKGRQTPNGMAYFISVYYKSEWLASFEAKYLDGKWILLPPVPDWIKENEPAIIHLLTANN